MLEISRFSSFKTPLSQMAFFMTSSGSVDAAISEALTDHAPDVVCFSSASA